MKAAEPKAGSSSNVFQAKSEEQQTPFFQTEKAGEASAANDTAFFSSRGSDAIQRKPFFNKPNIQPKLKIGQPGDKYEREADSVADQVVQRLAEPNQPETNASTSLSINQQPSLQRKPIFESEAEPDVQTKPLTTTFHPPSATLQPKCAECEKEEQLQKMDEPGEEEQFQMKPIFESATPPPDDDTVQRACAACATEEETVQTQSEGADTPASSPSLESRLQSSKGGGSPLSEDTRSQMEGAFGADFSGVRVHTDNSAVQMNQELGAQAFTHGSDVYFNAGKYDTGSTDGQRLLAHELTHTVQQGGGDVKTKANNDFSQSLSKTNPLIQRGVVDDFFSEYLTGNSIVDFLLGVAAGIGEWVEDLISGIVSLVRQTFEGNIGAIIAMGLIIVVIILAIIFPEVVIPILIGMGIIIGVISMGYQLVMMFMPGLSAYERGKRLGKALVEGLLLFLTIAEAARFVKTFAQVARMSEGVGLLQKLRWVRQLLRFGETIKVIQILDKVGDIEKTLEILQLVNDVNKAYILVGFIRSADEVDTLLQMLRTSGVLADDIIEFMRFVGMTIPDLNNLIRTPGMTLDRLRGLLQFPSMTVEVLKDLLARPGMTVEVLLDILVRPGMTVAELNNLLGRPNMTVLELVGLLNRPGMSVADLTGLLDLADNLNQLKSLLNLAPSIVDLKNYFTLAGGARQGARLEAILTKAVVLGDVRRAEDLLRLAGGSTTKFAELTDALGRFNVATAPGGVPAALHGYNGANIRHFQARHTYEFFDFAGAIENNPIKPSNTLWPAGTDVMPLLEEALTLLDNMVPPRRLIPFENPPMRMVLSSGIEVQIGRNNANVIGQFFPLENRGLGVITFLREEMNAFKRLLVP